jgi:SET domain-containing protein
MVQRSAGLFVGPSIYGGRGVFTIHDIEEDSLIEICPVIIIPRDQLAIIHQTVLHDYYFLWGDDSEQAAIALGFGSLYNHQIDPNTSYEMDFDNLCINLYSIRHIQAGEELTINYNGESGNDEKLWFDK